jgi:hypothetical protein
LGLVHGLGASAKFTSRPLFDVTQTGGAINENLGRARKTNDYLLLKAVQAAIKKQILASVAETIKPGPTAVGQFHGKCDI